MEADTSELVTLAEKQPRKLGVAQACRIRQYGIEDGLQFSGRTADDFSTSAVAACCSRASASSRLYVSSCCSRSARGSRIRPGRILAFVPVARNLRPCVRLFEPLRDEAT